MSGVFLTLFEAGRPLWAALLWNKHVVFKHWVTHHTGRVWEQIPSWSAVTLRQEPRPRALGHGPSQISSDMRFNYLTI